tara:strand:- start:256436 stop:257077 length:642 start_codon:yes stop_codon:yes gene_type:complete
MKIKILTNSLTPKELINEYCTSVSGFSLEDANKYDMIVDLTVGLTNEKIHLLQELNHEYKGIIISDTSTCWGENLEAKFQNLEACISLCFYSPKDNHEIYLKNKSSKEAKEALDYLFNLYEKTYVEVKTAGLGFTYPRVVSMIINEAFFSLEDELASPEDIDTAMKYGVNYPHGPFEWSEKIGLKIVDTLLTELYSLTGDPRYRSSLKLKLTK